MLTAAGSGYSRCDDLGVTRWREDATRDHCGSYIFLRDVQSGAVWSATYQPTGAEPDSYQATFSEDRAEFHRRDGAITTTLEVLVSAEDDAGSAGPSLRTRAWTRRRITPTPSSSGSPRGGRRTPAFSTFLHRNDRRARRSCWPLVACGRTEPTSAAHASSSKVPGEAPSSRRPGRFLV